MSETLKFRIQEDVKSAMRARETARLSVLRMVSAAIKQREIDSRTSLDDVGVVGVLEKMVKQRRDAEAQFRAAGRNDLSDREAFEIRVIQGYMPAPLSDDELQALVEDAITVCAATSMKDMGKVMAHLKPEIQGRADMGAVSILVKTRLSQGG